MSFGTSPGAGRPGSPPFRTDEADKKPTLIRERHVPRPTHAPPPRIIKYSRIRESNVDRQPVFPSNTDLERSFFFPDASARINEFLWSVYVYDGAYIRRYFARNDKRKDNFTCILRKTFLDIVATRGLYSIVFIEKFSILALAFTSKQCFPCRFTSNASIRWRKNSLERGKREKRIVSKRRGLFVYYSKTMDDKRHSRSMRRDRIGRLAIGWEALVSLWRTSVNSTTAIESETARPKWYCSEIIVSSKAPRIPIPWCHDGSRSIHEISFFLTHFPRPWNERSSLTDTRITFAIPCFLGTETKRSCREIRSEILLSCWYLLIARNRFALLISSNEISTCVSSIYIYVYTHRRKSFLENFLIEKCKDIFRYADLTLDSIPLWAWFEYFLHLARWRSMLEFVLHSPIDSMNSKRI